jgi:hypothetical protein
MGVSPMSITGVPPVKNGPQTGARPRRGRRPLVLTGKPNGPLRRCPCYGRTAFFNGLLGASRPFRD